MSKPGSVLKYDECSSNINRSIRKSQLWRPPNVIRNPQSWSVLPFEGNDTRQCDQVWQFE